MHGLILAAYAMLLQLYNRRSEEQLFLFIISGATTCFTLLGSADAKRRWFPMFETLAKSDRSVVPGVGLPYSVHPARIPSATHRQPGPILLPMHEKRL